MLEEKELFDILDLTKYNGGIVFAYIDIGKMPPQRVKDYLNRLKNEMRPIISYLEYNGFMVLLLPRQTTSDNRGHKWGVWGMNKPYDPSFDEPEESKEINLDVLSQAIEASSRRLKP